MSDYTPTVLQRMAYDRQRREASDAEKKRQADRVQRERFAAEARNQRNRAAAAKVIGRKFASRLRAK